MILFQSRQCVTNTDHISSADGCIKHSGISLRGREVDIEVYFSSKPPLKTNAKRAVSTILSVFLHQRHKSLHFAFATVAANFSGRRRTHHHICFGAAGQCPRQPMDEGMESCGPAPSVKGRVAQTWFIRRQQTVPSTAASQTDCTAEPSTLRINKETRKNETKTTTLCSLLSFFGSDKKEENFFCVTVVTLS